ncbi:Serine phosphatase RsbU, regulator of sigma subunit [hydrothermal vent metagenome]|uniref:Serine phosphatase RsbU, regulator of sigma subunit n=1 Tax=hydrothermal vent metagenome TaxID=652676 RepID=A0A3B1DWQ0_9ZZZZ
MARLILLQGGKATLFALTSKKMVLGRHPDCEIHLEESRISRQHASVRKEGRDFFIQDLGSGNGTSLNGKEVTKEEKLSHADRIKLGPVLLRFELDNPPSSQGSSILSVMPGSSGFQVDLEGDEISNSSVMGTVAGTSGFGALDVRPEAKLQAVLKISRSLAGTVETKEILPGILDTLFDIFPHADRGCILLKEKTSEQMIPAAQKHRREGDDETVKLSRTIIQQVLNERQGILSADAASDRRFQASESISNLTIRSMMCVPMLNLDGEPMGIINIDTQNPLKQFKNEDIELLLAVAGQAALSFESAMLLKSHLEKMKQDSEMEIAHNVQQALLPSELPKVDGYRFFASYDSAQAVGGDYYDAIMLGDGKICLSFGDVAGKGVPGALIMSRISSCVQNVMKYVHDVGDAMIAINNHMCHHAAEGRFVTYVLVVIDLSSHEMRLSVAGHMPPLIRKADGTIDSFNDEIVGLPIGVVEDYPYEVVSRKLEPGETVVIITDGVDEAMNPEGNLYTKERVVKFIKTGSSNPDELGKALLADVRQHANGRPQNDDITIMTFGRLAE